MKKITFLLFICCFTNITLFSQITNHATERSVYNDADKIIKDLATIANALDTIADKNKKTADKNNAIANKDKATIEINHILSSYFSNADEIADFNTKYGQNLTTDYVPSKNTALQTSESQAGNIPQVLSNQTMAIDALSTFIANRFKQEINIAFLNKFKETVNTIPLFKTLFPKTDDVLQNSDPFNYPVFIQTLQEAFQYDLSHCSEKLPTVLEELAAKTNDAKSKAVLKMASKLINVKTISELPKVLEELANDNDIIAVPEFKEQLYVLNITVNALKKNGDGLAMFLNSTADIKKFNDAEYVKIYTALLIRQNELYFTDLGIKAATLTKITETASAIKKIIPELEAVAKEVKIMNSNSALNKLTAEDVQKAITVLLNSLEKSSNTLMESGWFTNAPAADKTNFTALTQNARMINDFTGFILEKKYGLALNSIANFIITHSTLDEDEKTMVRKGTGFIANALNAETKEDLMDALETSANPIGSYRIKRNSTYNISLNAYAGGFIGTNKQDGETQILYGFTAPVGVYLGLGNIWKDKEDLNSDNGKSFGLFLPLVDVGAVTAFRLKDGDTELADVSWSNVFAPGAYASFGFGKCPLSLNLGGQMGPELKSVNDDGTSVLVEKQWYWRAGLVVDISIFDFLIKQTKYDEKK